MLQYVLRTGLYSFLYSLLFFFLPNIPHDVFGLFENKIVVSTQNFFLKTFSKFILFFKFFSTFSLLKFFHNFFQKCSKKFFFNEKCKKPETKMHILLVTFSFSCINYSALGSGRLMPSDVHTLL